jgi:hypothetical protein
MPRMKLVGLSPHSISSTDRSFGHLSLKISVISTSSIHLLGAGATHTWSG